MDEEFENQNMGQRQGPNALQTMDSFIDRYADNRVQKDIDAINNRKKDNLEDNIGNRKNQNNNDDSSNGKNGLEKKDGLEDNNDNSSNKKDNKEGKPSTEEQKKAKEEAKKKAEAAAKKKAEEKALASKAKLKLKMKIYLYVGGAALGLLSLVFLVAFFAFAFNNLTSSITSFFGVSEKGLDDDSDDIKTSEKDGLYTDKKYRYVTETCDVKNYDEAKCACDPDNGDKCVELGWEELVNVLYSDDKCKVDDALYRMWDKISSIFTGDRFSSECALLRYIRGTINDYQDKFKTELDMGLIVSTIFYGYDQQAHYRNYKTSSAAENADYTEAAEHYQVLLNIIKDGKLKRTDVDRIIQNTIFEEVYPYWTWSTWTDQYGNKHGACRFGSVINYHYSSDKWKMFIRWNDELSDPNNRQEFSVPGYIGLTRSIDTNIFSSKKMLDRSSIALNVNQTSNLYGSGYVYDSNMNNSYTASSDECNGQYTGSQLKAMFDLAEIPSGVDGKDDCWHFFNDRGYTGLVDTTHYFQHIEETSSSEKDIFTPKNGVKYMKSSGTLSTYNINYDYKEGFGYFVFPGFKQAIEDPNTDLEYDEAITPKEVETIIEEVMDKKKQMNEVLLAKDLDSVAYGENGTYDENGNYIEGIVPNTNGEVTTNANCKPYLTADLSNINVTVKDCDGATLGTVGFKDYIIGVTKGEIDNYKNKNYALTAMIAEISYSLNRRNNYAKGSTITMRSGNCDQVFSSPAKGSHSKTANISCGSFKCTSFLIGPNSSGGYYKGPMSQDEYNAYSELYDEASKYLVIKGDKIKSTGYVNTTQNKWKNMANNGANFVEIIKSTYTDSDLVQCYDGNSTGNND